MTRTFDVSGKLPDDVVQALRILDHHLGDRGIRYVLVGALARDVVTSVPQGTIPGRATKDVDLAVRVDSMEHFTQAMEGLERVGDHDHKFRVAGLEIDVVPFGPVAASGHVKFSDSVLDVSGLAEAAEQSDEVRVADDLVVGSASVAALAVLKVLAWRDRRSWTNKDAVDLLHLFTSVVSDPYADDVWGDDAAGALVDFDGALIGAAWLGHRAGEMAAPGSRAAVQAVLESQSQLLAHDMGDDLAEELVDAFAKAFLGPEG